MSILPYEKMEAVPPLWGTASKKLAPKAGFEPATK